VEWNRARDLIEKQDDRIHDTRKLVFGLFTTALFGGVFLAGQNPALLRSDTGANLFWFSGIAFILLLFVGRFIEQQSHFLQSAAATRARVLELTTPLELTDVVSERFTKHVASRTMGIYLALGLIVTLLVGLGVWQQTPPPRIERERTTKTETHSEREKNIQTVTTTERETRSESETRPDGAPPRGRLVTFLSNLAVLGWGFLLIALGYFGYLISAVFTDKTSGPRKQDWSFDRTTCQAGEEITISLLMLDKALPWNAALVQLSGVNGNSTPLPANLLRPDGEQLPRGRAVRWIWKPTVAGLWALRITPPVREKSDSKEPKVLYARRILLVTDNPKPTASTAHPGEKSAPVPE
jgi:hypothetical protein